MGTTKTKTSGSFGTMFSKRWLLFFTIAVAIIFGVISPAFLQVTNLLNILSSACIVGVMGVGLTCIFATGELDFLGRITGITGILYNGGCIRKNIFA